MICGLERKSGHLPWLAASLCGERSVLLGIAQSNSSRSVATRERSCEHGSTLAAPSLDRSGSFQHAQNPLIGQNKKRIKLKERKRNT